MATIVASKIIEEGLTSSLATCTAAGDDFVNTGIEFIRIQNTHASATYTIKVSVSATAVKHPQYGELTKSNIYKTIAGGASASIFIGPFKQKAFNDLNQRVQVNYKLNSGTTDSAFNALDNITGSHNLKIEILYLDN